MDLLGSVARKIQRGERLSDAEATALFRIDDLPALGDLADEVNRRHNQDVVFYNINRHINPTNVCALSCKFCSFSRKPTEDEAFALTVEEVVARARQAYADGATEVHMVGGLHPRWPYEHYIDIVRGVHRALPDLHIKAFTAVELDWLAKKGRRSIEQVLKDLMAAGLGSLPGGGAEIFHPEVRERICATKVDAATWLGIHELAHGMGLRSNCTMLYGHIETPEHRVDHMRRLRELQDRTHGFNAFIPLAFQPFDNDMGIDRFTPGVDDLKTLAIARLYLDNFLNIKAYWVVLGQDIAQMGLQFGANDLDGTIVDEKISKMAGGHSGSGLAVQQIMDRIRDAQKRPQERDTLYRPVNRSARGGGQEAGGRTQQRFDVGPLVTRGLGDAKLGLVEKIARQEHLDPWDWDVLLSHLTLHELARLLDPERPRTLSLCPTRRLGAADLDRAWTVDERRQWLSEGGVETSGLTLCVDGSELLERGLSGAQDLASELDRWRAAGCQHIVLEDDGALRRIGVDKSGARLLEEVLDLLVQGGPLVFKGQASGVGWDEVECFVHERWHERGVSTVGRLWLKGDPLESVGAEEVSSLRMARSMGGAQVMQQFQCLPVRGTVPGHPACLSGIEIWTDGGVSSYQYLRTLAVARLVLPQRVRVVAPWSAIPVAASRSSQASGSKSIAHDPKVKVAPLVAHYGSTHLGWVEVRDEAGVQRLADLVSEVYGRKGETTESQVILGPWSGPGWVPPMFGHQAHSSGAEKAGESGNLNGSA